MAHTDIPYRAWKGMISPRQIRIRALKYWNSGRVLKAWIGSEPLFPLIIPAGRPTAAHALEHFAEVRAWKEALEKDCACISGNGYRIEYAELNHRQLGRQRLPKQVVFEKPIDLTSFVGKLREMDRFASLSREIRGHHPALGDWIDRYPMKVLEHAGDWPRLLNVLDFFHAHPRPDHYLRELEIPDVDSKFIEQNKGVLSELIDRILPPEAMDAAVTGLVHHGFERRYGLKYDEPLIRFRFLDDSQAERFGGLHDITVPLGQFVLLEPTCRWVFITENKINGLSFPRLKDAMVVFGLGYGISALKEITWLQEKGIHYWGDIDTHGFAILSRLRGYLPRARSFLMDRVTLDHFRSLWVEEPATRRFTGELSHLTEDEHSLYELLRDNALGKRVRLEQERISFNYVKESLDELSQMNRQSRSLSDLGDRSEGKMV